MFPSGGQAASVYLPRYLPLLSLQQPVGGLVTKTCCLRLFPCTRMALGYQEPLGTVAAGDDTEQAWPSFLRVTACPSPNCAPLPIPPFFFFLRLCLHTTLFTLLK